MKDGLLPPRPGEAPATRIMAGEKAGGRIPVVVYINGYPIEMTKSEALGVMAQIVNIFLYLDNAETETVPVTKEAGKYGK